MRINSTHSMADRGQDFYPTPKCAIDALIRLERHALPNFIWEPAMGDGAIAKPLADAGYSVIGSDISDHGAGYKGGVDYLKTKPTLEFGAIVTNPPYKHAMAFIQKAVEEVPYSAWLLRINFLESVGRLPFFRATPPARVWVSSRRLPMMHRHGWEGPKAPSNMCYAWFIFERGASQTTVNWFDWQESEG